MANRNIKAQIIEQIKQANNILVAINNKPSLDQLTTALALTLALSKNDKRATAIFSGDVPEALDFLQPEKIFDRDINGLRDFIISLDTTKADYVKTKVIDDMVRVSITPAKKAISESDLNFSQGDYNVDLVLAVGVEREDHLDKVLINHGRVLHNAFVASMTIGDEQSSLGSANWSRPDLVSYGQLAHELLTSLSNDDQEVKEEFIDQSVATALMAGLIVVTDRFSNKKTDSSVMKMAAELMAKDINQQLIVSELNKKEKQKVEDNSKVKELAPASKINKNEIEEVKNPNLVNQKEPPALEPVKNKISEAELDDLILKVANSKKQEVIDNSETKTTVNMVPEYNQDDLAAKLETAETDLKNYQKGISSKETKQDETNYFNKKEVPSEQKKGNSENKTFRQKTKTIEPPAGMLERNAGLSQEINKELGIAPPLPRPVIPQVQNAPAPLPIEVPNASLKKVSGAIPPPPMPTAPPPMPTAPPPTFNTSAPIPPSMPPMPMPTAPNLNNLARPINLQSPTPPKDDEFVIPI